MDWAGARRAIEALIGVRAAVELRVLTEPGRAVERANRALEPGRIDAAGCGKLAIVSPRLM